MSNIVFNKPYFTGREEHYVNQAYLNGKLSGAGQFSQKCEAWLQSQLKSQKVLLTPSCTSALEMAAMLIGTQPGDEIIMPSYTFVSTANAFVLRGGVPVFVDIRPDTLNINESKIEQAITSKTKAIVPVHYAGVGCEMDRIDEIAKKYKLFIIEDAAQGILSTYNNRPLGGIGHLATLSFHETKNIMSGEGGALLINDSALIEKAEIIREKGTNRSRFLRGEVDKYTWVDIGSSFLPSEITAAFLWAQLEQAQHITERRINLWNKYHDVFKDSPIVKSIRQPIIPDSCQHNAHMYYMLFPDSQYRTRFIEEMAKRNIQTVFHYVPLHSSEGGRRYGRVSGHLPVTEDISERLVRLPLWLGLEEHIEYVIESILEILVKLKSSASLFL